MRMQSGITDQYIYFVAVDATDLKTRETGLSAFTVYRSRDGGAATAYTTPTINETDSVNMPGVYELLLDEDMTIAAGNDSEEVCLHITCTGMAPVTRTFELYRPLITAGSTITVANSCVDADIERLQGNAIATPTVAGVLEVDVTHWIGTAAATPTVAGVPEVDITHIGGAAVSTSTAQLGVNAVQAGGTAWGSGAITAASIATGAVDADAIAADAATEIANAVWDTDATGRQTQGTFGQAIGDPAADTNSIFKAVVTDATGATVGVDVVAIKAETVNILADTAEIGAAGAGLTAINLPDQTMNITGDITGNLSGSVGSVTAGVTLAASAVQAIWDALTTALTTVGSIGKRLVDNITGDAYVRLGAPAGASVSADIAAVKSDTAAILVDTGTTLDGNITAIKAKTDSLTFTVANMLDSNIQAVNDVTVTGNGQAGTEWGP